MKEIILEKRYPHSREEDITDAFMRGYEIGKEQEHRWWSAFCANCKTESNSEKPNNCDTCKHNKLEWYSEVCDSCCGNNNHYEPKDEPQTEEEYINSLPWTEVGNGEQTDCPWK